jgi:succinoglycan biosynthesis transport protein ExoP
MTFPQLLSILRARYKVILLTLLIAVAATAAVSFSLPRIYRTSATLLLNYKGTDPVSGRVLPAQLVSGYIATQVDIVGSRGVALKAVDMLGLADNPATQQRFRQMTGGKGAIREWLADSLQKMVDVAPSRESSMIEISAKGSDPAFTAQAANGIAAAYQQLNLQIKVEPLRQAAKYFTQQTTALRAELEQAEEKMSRYQQEHGLVSADSHQDVETARLNELSSQLVLAQGQGAEASSRGSQATGRGGRDSPDVISNVLVQNLKASLAAAEGKFALLSQNLDRNHPQYQAAKAEVDQLRSELNSSISATNAGAANNARIQRQRVGEIRAALTAQTAKVLQLNRARDELSVLAKDVESAQHAYDAAAQRLSQTELEGQSNQSDVSVLNPAMVPTRPASPNIPLNMVLSLLFGSMLGLALAVLAELANRRIRTGNDLLNALDAPMLGTIVWRKPARRIAFPQLFLSR